MTDQQQRTQWALDQFRSFVKQWTAPGAWYPSTADRVQIEHVITAIAPKDEAERQVGYGVPA